MSAVTKGQLIEQLAHRFPDLQALDIQTAVGIILGDIIREVEQGGRCEIRGFGTFRSTTLKARIGRNPKTAEPVALPDRRRFHFKPSRLLHASLNAPKEETNGNN